MGLLADKKAIVTGAGRGLGQAIALRFAAEGASLALLSRGKTSLEESERLIKSAGGQAVAIVCDVLDTEQISRAVAQAADALGGIDILVNNVHDTQNLVHPLADLSLEDLDRQLRLGPHAVLTFMQACKPFMEAASRGTIINMASGAGVGGIVGYGAYAASKEAVRALTRVAAREWASLGITVNAICPAAMTDPVKNMITQGMPEKAPSALAHFGSPTEDIAPIALFLASDHARFITGYTIMADGGMLIDAAR